MLVSRRSLIRSGALTLVGGASSQALALAARLAPTVHQTVGPFYPVRRPLDQDSDLTIVRGRRGRARGQIINVVGRVLNPDGRPVPFASLDLWQANAVGATPIQPIPIPLLSIRIFRVRPGSRPTPTASTAFERSSRGAIPAVCLISIWRFQERRGE